MVQKRLWSCNWISNDIIYNWQLWPQNGFDPICARIVGWLVDLTHGNWKEMLISVSFIMGFLIRWAKFSWLFGQNLLYCVMEHNAGLTKSGHNIEKCLVKLSSNKKYCPTLIYFQKKSNDPLHWKLTMKIRSWLNYY